MFVFLLSNHLSSFDPGFLFNTLSRISLCVQTRNQKGDLSSDDASHSPGQTRHPLPSNGLGALAGQCNDLSTETQTPSEPPAATSNSYDHVNDTHGEPAATSGQDGSELSDNYE